eukprot:204981_1
MDKISLIKLVSNWQCQLLHFTLTQLWIVLYQPSWIIYSNGNYIFTELFHIFIWCFLFSCISVKGFLILHDCSHNTFFDAAWKNEICGRVFGVLEACPFGLYKESHLRHHVIQGNLEKIDLDSIHFTTKQVEELIPNKFLKSLYVVWRFPLIFFSTAPILLWFVAWPLGCIQERDPYVIIGYAVRVFGLWYFSGNQLSFNALYWSAKINLITGYFAIFMGVVLFHIQHSCNPAYRAKKSNGFKQKNAALYGSVTHKVPFIFKFFTMGIEYHTMHHWDMGLPGYTLQYYHYRVQDMKNLKYELVKNSQIKKCQFDKRLINIKVFGYKDIYDCLFNVVYDEKKKKYLSWW